MNASPFLVLYGLSLELLHLYLAIQDCFVMPILCLTLWDLNHRKYVFLPSRLIMIPDHKVDLSLLCPNIFLTLSLVVGSFDVPPHLVRLIPGLPTHPPYPLLCGNISHPLSQVLVCFENTQCDSSVKITK